MLVITVVFFIGGAIKGLVGIGMPTFVMAVLSQFLDPRFAIALLLVPIVAANGLQTIRSGFVTEAVTRYWQLYVPMTAGFLVFTQLASITPAQTMKIAVGIFIVLFVLTSLLTVDIKIPRKYDSIFQVVSGTTAGVMGGLAAMTAPPLIMYLTARRLPKSEFVGVVGFFLFLSGIFLTIGYLKAGLTTVSLLSRSAMLIVPVVIGMRLGEIFHQHLDELVFRKVILFVFFVLGVNLIRVAVI